MQGLIEQTNPGLYKDINEFGCFFRSAQAIAEIWENNTLTIDDINKAWDKAIDKKWLVANGRFYLLSKPVEVITDAFDILGNTSSTAINVGVENSDGNNWLPWWGNEWNFVVWCFNTPSGGTHYRLYDTHNTLIYDPYPHLTLGNWFQKSRYKVQKR